jgi:O-antigen ligase
LIAGFVGSLAPAIAASRSARVAALAAAGCAAALGVGVAVAQIPNPNPHATGSASANTTPCTPRDAECSLRLEDEIGRPAGGGYVPTKHRSIFGSSGRGQAWQGALEQGAKRPVAGYGFGTESRVFVDRYYSFEGGVPENSYIGMFLQLGAVGVGVFIALLVSLVVAGGRALVPAERQGRVLAATCGAVLLVGLALGLFQSYLYAAGNNATLSVWICAFLLTALAARPRTSS